MIYKTMYTIAWYKLPTLLKTEIHLVILRSQKPSKITAGKFYVMHLENFNGVRNNYFLQIKYIKVIEFLQYVYNRYFKDNLTFIGVEYGCFILYVASQFWFG